jgi:hypothetical protein
MAKQRGRGGQDKGIFYKYNYNYINGECIFFWPDETQEVETEQVLSFHEIKVE